MNYLTRSRTPLRFFPALAGAAVTAALPQDCAVCGAYAGRWPVCPACEAALPGLPERRCPHCADRSESGDVCARCLSDDHGFDATVAAFAYAPPVDGLVQALKYGHRLHLADWFGDRLADRLGDQCEAPAVIAMPLHPARLAERGFNQATEIARPLARRLGVRLAHSICARVRPTPPQARLALADRRANVRQAFECRTDFGGRTVVLVDDVMTSGASLGELARTVRLHGAGRVIAAVAARTVHA